MKEIRIIKIRASTVKCIVHRIDVTGKSESQIEKIENGLLRNMDRENYYTEVVDEPSKPDNCTQL